MAERTRYVSQLKQLQLEFAEVQEYASEYDLEDSRGHFYNTRIRSVSELLTDFKSGKVLDIGCGPAIISNAFHGKQIEYYGLDISKDMIEFCIGRYGNDPKMHFLQGRIEELPFQDGLFDAILCLGAFEYVLDEGIAMSEIIRVLSPQGIFIITMLNGASPYWVWHNCVYQKLTNYMSRLLNCTKGGGIRRGGLSRKRQGYEFHVYEESTLGNLLTSKGMKIMDKVYYDFNLLLSPLDHLFPKMAVSISSSLESLCRSKLNILGKGLILKCSKL